MKRLGIGILIVVTVMGCSTASSISSLASNPLVSSLTSGLGLNTTQAVGAAGAVLGSAQSKLSPSDWNKVSSAVPGSDTLVKEAKSVTGTTGNFGDVSSLGGTLSKLGLNSSQISGLVPAVTGAVSKIAGPEVGNILAGALK